ncbi:hypothetical protein [Nostoc sp.]|uniref:hypothetical protein n=1 Tax=Nostoc sp. TaxID=1180 RepID=UPI002FF66C37
MCEARPGKYLVGELGIGHWALAEEAEERRGKEEKLTETYFSPAPPTSSPSEVSLTAH